MRVSPISLSLVTAISVLTSGASGALKAIAQTHPERLIPALAQTNPAARRAEALELYRQGTRLFNVGQYREALAIFEQVLVIVREIGERQGEGATLNNIGLVYRNLGQYPQALEQYQQSLAISREVGDRAGEGNTLNNIGSVYQSLGQYPQALEQYQQSLAITRQVGDSPEERLRQRAGEGNTLNSIGLVYDHLGQYPQALEQYQQSLAILREVGDRAGEGVTLNNIGAVYRNLGQYPQALEQYQQALAILHEVGNRAGEGATLNGIGLVYDNLGQYPRALEQYQQALAIFRQVGDSPEERLRQRAGEGTTLNNIGSVYQNLGQYPQALEQYQQSLAIIREIGDRAGEGGSLNNIGSVYDNLGQYPQALEQYQQSLAIRREVGDRAGEGVTLNNIGSVYRNLGQYPQALEQYQQALAILHEVGDRAGEGATLNGIGLVYDNLGQYPQALEQYQQALAIRRQVGDRAGEGATLNNIGAVYQSLGQYPQALEQYQQSLAIRREVGDRAGEGTTLNNIGSVYRNLGQYPQALEQYQQALAILREVGDRAGEAITLWNIGSLLANQSQAQPQLAIVFYKQSVNITEAIRQELGGLPQETQEAYTQTVTRTYRELADLLLQQDRVLEAQRVLDLLKVQELDDYLRDVRGTQNTATGIEVLRPEQEILDRYNELQKTAIQLGDELAQLRHIAQAQRTSQQQGRIAQLVQLQEALNGQFNQFIDSDAVQQLVAQLTTTARRQNLNLEDLTGLQDNLQQLHAALLYPLILDDRLELVITTPNAPPLRRTVNVGREELNRAIVAFRQALEDPSSDATVPAQQLYNWLIKPIENDLTQAQVQTIIYAPDGQLRYIPLAALYDAQHPGEEWLVQRYRINNITARSLTDLTTQPSRTPQILAAAFADANIRYAFPVGQGTQAFQGLPFAGQEVTNLAALFPGTTQLLNRAFSLEAVRPRMNENTIVHFATHAVFVPGTPDDSFILFGNGDRPTLRDIENWSLQNVDLVVLSACETGLGGQFGNGEELLGLGYQMQRAGARAAIASLWSVSDGGTQALMESFYAALQQPSISKAEALRQAQIALITDNYEALDDQQRGLVVVRPRIREGVPAQVVSRLRHPYYWAPFILIGNGL